MSNEKPAAKRRRDDRRAEELPTSLRAISPYAAVGYGVAADAARKNAKAASRAVHIALDGLIEVGQLHTQLLVELLRGSLRIWDLCLADDDRLAAGPRATQRPGSAFEAALRGGQAIMDMMWETERQKGEIVQERGMDFALQLNELIQGMTRH